MNGLQWFAIQRSYDIPSTQPDLLGPAICGDGGHGHPCGIVNLLRQKTRNLFGQLHTLF